MRPADCHPDRPMQAFGLCQLCYVKEWRRKNKDKTQAYHRARDARIKADPALLKAERERQRNFAREHRDYWNKRNKERRAAGLDRDQRRARAAVNNALADGHLTRQPCESCGARAEAHHPLGYAPEHYLTIQWLCRPHHQEAHGGIWKPVHRRAA